MKVRPFLVACMVSVWASASQADWKDDVGFTALAARLGTATPTGAGIAVSHVEAPFNGNYLPDAANAEFAGKTINVKSGAGSPSSHATTVGQYYYGLTVGMAGGINTIDAYDVNNWLDIGLLRVATSLAPKTEVRRVENHSWVGTTGTDSIDIDMLRRMDLVVQRDGVVVAVGVNNGAGSALPRLLGSAYNVLAVGLTNGNSSYGPTPIDVVGRVKPDIVVPIDATSWAAPIVASSGALLLQTADANGILPQLGTQEKKTAKALLVKTLLMAGATKNEFADWRKGLATPSTDGTVPLDYRYGAGELNIDNSHRILSRGEQNASSSTDVTTTGWDYGSASLSGEQFYFFEIPAFSRADSVSILVTWNRQITVGIGNPAPLTPSLANIDLRLYGAIGYTVDSLRDQSLSSIDNVEHIFLRWLPAGRYAIAVASDRTWSYAVAWDIHTSPTVPSDFDGDGDVDLLDFARLRNCFNGPNRSPALADCGDADLDGDSDVDLLDFSRFRGCFNGSNQPPVCPS